MLRFYTAILPITFAVLSGCAQVPQAAIDVSRQVSSGISSIGNNGQDVVTAWEETTFALLDERWKQIYKKADNEFRKKRQVANTAVLTAEQQEEVAGLAALIRDESRKKIAARANEMRKVIGANTKTTLEANESVTQLLVSASAVLATQQAAARQVADQAKLPTDLGKFVSSLIEP